MIQIFDNENFTFQYCQENEQYNKKGVLRGLHYQIEPYAQAKYCHVGKGRVLSVAIDIRKGSKSFGQWESYELNDIDHKYMFIPKGFAHGYITLSDESIFIYQVDEYFHPEAMRGVAFDDKDLKIDWKINHKNIIVSQKDANNPKFGAVEIYKGKVC